MKGRSWRIIRNKGKKSKKNPRKQKLKKPPPKKKKKNNKIKIKILKGRENK
jgi:hypothetical protein